MTKDPMHPKGLSEKNVSNLLKSDASDRYSAAIKSGATGASHGGTARPGVAASPRLSRLDGQGLRRRGRLDFKIDAIRRKTNPPRSRGGGAFFWLIGLMTPLR
jgi:hypothetical protein